MVPTLDRTWLEADQVYARSVKDFENSLRYSFASLSEVHGVKEPSHLLFNTALAPIALLELRNLVLGGYCLAATLSEYDGF